MFALLASMALLGVLHGVGPDHCLALSALAARGRHREILRTSLAFGAGHAFVLFLFAGGLGLVGLTMPERWVRAGELANGMLLVLLGAGLAFERLGSGLTAHSHLHRHGPTVHAHPHVHRLQRPRLPQAAAAVRFVDESAHGQLAHPHGHSRSAWAVGAVFALSGIRSAALALPIALQGRVGWALAALACFGLGVVLSMSGYGLLFAFARRWADARGLTERRLRVGLGLASATFGGYWILAA